MSDHHSRFDRGSPDLEPQVLPLVQCICPLLVVYMELCTLNKAYWLSVERLSQADVDIHISTHVYSPLYTCIARNIENVTRHLQELPPSYLQTLEEPMWHILLLVSAVHDINQVYQFFWPSDVNPTFSCHMQTRLLVTFPQNIVFRNLYYVKYTENVIIHGASSFGTLPFLVYIILPTLFRPNGYWKVLLFSKLFS